MLSGIITLFLLLLFIAIAIWAWLPRNKKSFEATARLAVEDEQDARQERQDGNANDGEADGNGPDAGHGTNKGTQA